MTNERAKEVLQEQIDRYGQEYDAEGIEALNKAIEVLEQQPCEDVLDKIKAQILEKFDNCSICEWFENYDYDENDISEYMSVGHILDIIDIIDKYIEGSESE